jgi:hypothetical protein
MNKNWAHRLIGSMLAGGLTLILTFFVFLNYTLAQQNLNSSQQVKPLKLGPLIAGPSCSEKDRVKWLFDLMRSGEYGKMISQPELDTAALSWQDIPSLLKLAVSTRVLRAYPACPISSGHISGSDVQTVRSEGTVALWFIEGIRTKAKWPSLEPILYRTKVDGSENLQSDAAQLYGRWWDKVKNLPHEEAGKIDPLKDSGIHWT